MTPQASLNIIEEPSPNHGERRAPYGTLGPRLIVIHYTDMVPVEAALARLCDPAAAVSAHYLIARDGTVTRLVDETRRAWHAGQSAWTFDDAEETDINSASIGIELDNPGHSNGYVAFTAVQIDHLVALCRANMARWDIPLANIVGHSDIAPGRKQDPGHLFPWDEFRARLKA